MKLQTTKVGCDKFLLLGGDFSELPTIICVFLCISVCEFRPCKESVLQHGRDETVGVRKKNKKLLTLTMFIVCLF